MAVDAAIVAEHIDDHLRALKFIFQMWSVNEDLLIVADGQIEMFKEDRGFIARVFV